MIETDHDRIRERLLAKSGLTTLGLMGRQLDYNSLRETEWCSEFEAMMRDRLIMGAFRYGTIAENRGKKYGRIADAIRRLGRFQETGNMEYLVDAANFMMLEFIHKDHPNAHFESVDDGEHAKRA